MSHLYLPIACFVCSAGQDGMSVAALVVLLAIAIYFPIITTTYWVLLKKIPLATPKGGVA